MQYHGNNYAAVLKLADGADSKSVAEMRVGSSPTSSTLKCELAHYNKLYIKAVRMGQKVCKNRKLARCYLLRNKIVGEQRKNQSIMRSRAVVACQTHYLEVGGSIPSSRNY